MTCIYNLVENARWFPFPIIMDSVRCGCSIQFGEGEACLYYYALEFSFEEKLEVEVQIVLLDYYYLH